MQTNLGATLLTRLRTRQPARSTCPPAGRSWAINPEEYERLFADGRIAFGLAGDSAPKRKLFLRERLAKGDTRTPSSVQTSCGTTKDGSAEVAELLGAKKIFSYPKPTSFIAKLIQYSIYTERDQIVLDFFAGSSTTAHAVLRLNAGDGGNRRFIMVQFPEPCDSHSEASSAGYSTVSDISKERIRRAGRKILGGVNNKEWNKDIGFRVLKVDSSNMTDVHYSPDIMEQSQLMIFADNVKLDRNPEDLLFQVLIDWGADLSLPIRTENIQGKLLFLVNQPPQECIACFDTGVDEDLVKQLAMMKPMRVVFRDTGFATDSVKINVEQIFRQISPSTEVQSI